ncbi:hypothetical protein Q3G72_011501 [Acer saccharum]|nr:hypothetical protein Q3G72_011501 [Acer saccharum]
MTERHVSSQEWRIKSPYALAHVYKYDEAIETVQSKGRMCTLRQLEKMGCASHPLVIYKKKAVTTSKGETSQTPSNIEETRLSTWPSFTKKFAPSPTQPFLVGHLEEFDILTIDKKKKLDCNELDMVQLLGLGLSEI